MLRAQQWRAAAWHTRARHRNGVSNGVTKAALALRKAAPRQW